MRSLHSTLVLFAIFSVLGLSSCGDNQDPEGARAFWEEIQSLNYRSFARAPGYATRSSSNAPHGDEVDIYINEVVEEALQASSPITTWPIGSLIIKDGFDDNGVHELVAVMEKRESGWYWAEYFDLESGEAKFSGQPQICLSCHQSGADYVLAFPFP